MKPQTIYSHLTDIALYDQNPHIAVLSKRNEERDNDRGCGAEGRAGKEGFFCKNEEGERASERDKNDWSSEGRREGLMVRKTFHRHLSRFWET